MFRSERLAEFSGVDKYCLGICLAIGRVKSHKWDVMSFLRFDQSPPASQLRTLTIGALQRAWNYQLKYDAKAPDVPIETGLGIVLRPNSGFKTPRFGNPPGKTA
jgi:hypothetical protein